MKKSFPFAAALFGACAAIGYASAAPLQAVNGPEDQTGSIAAPNLSNLSSSRIYCFIGATGEPSNMHRGWVCISESTPESS